SADQMFCDLIPLLADRRHLVAPDCRVLVSRICRPVMSSTMRLEEQSRLSAKRREKNFKFVKRPPLKFLEESSKINRQTEQHDMNATAPSDAARLELGDNGKGFISDNANGDGIGLIGMKERAEQIGATLAITSEPGAGTTIIAVSPSNSQ